MPQTRAEKESTTKTKRARAALSNMPSPAPPRPPSATPLRQELEAVVANASTTEVREADKRERWQGGGRVRHTPECCTL
jgi:hypothetical protein